VDLNEIDVYIDPDGQVRIEVRGVQGPACLALTAELEAALGGAVVSRELTPEAQASLGSSLPRAQHIQKPQ
jgi:hypothetical protein